MSGPRCLVRLTIHSVFDTLDLIQVVSDRFAALGGLDEDATHWVGVSVRESVINAIKHGNRFDPSKIVTVEFALEPPGDVELLPEVAHDLPRACEFVAVVERLYSCRRLRAPALSGPEGALAVGVRAPLAWPATFARYGHQTVS